jgi:hypothetical protein
LRIPVGARDDVRRELQRAAANLDPSHRRFDVRVDDVVVADARFGFTVVTLSNHPYGGARSWQIRRHGPDVYELATAELNTYAWLPDATVELVTRGAATRSLWSGQLGAFVDEVGGERRPPADATLSAVAPTDSGWIVEGTSFLTPETLPTSPLARWIRANFPTLDAMARAAGFS